MARHHNSKIVETGSNDGCITKSVERTHNQFRQQKSSNNPSKLAIITGQSNEFSMIQTLKQELEIYSRIVKNNGVAL